MDDAATLGQVRCHNGMGERAPGKMELPDLARMRDRGRDRGGVRRQFAAPYPPCGPLQDHHPQRRVLRG